MSTLRSSNLLMTGPIILRADAAPVTIPVGGVLTRSLTQPHVIVLPNAGVLDGMAGVYPSGDPLDPREDDVHLWLVQANGSCTITHQAVGVPADQQITTYTGADVVLGTSPHQLTYSYNGSSWVWSLLA